MRVSVAVLMALAVLGLVAGAAQAYTVTHNGTEVLFSDDMEGPYFEAEVGSWGRLNDGLNLLAFKTLKTGSSGSGPAAAADGTDYAWVSRDATQAYWQEAVFTHPVSTGYLDIDFQYFTWINNPWPQPVTLDNNVGLGVGLMGTIASILQDATHANWYDFANSADTGAPINPAVWNRWQMHVDLDADTYQITLNGTPGNVVSTADGTIGRIGINFNDTNKEFFLDAAPGTPGPVPVPDTQTFLTTEDAFIAANGGVEGNPDADTNYGTLDHLIVKSWGDVSYALQRKGYVKWDISGLTDPAVTARIQLQHVYNHPGLDPPNPQQGLDVYVLNDGDVGEGWTEEVITWNNAPANIVDHPTDFDEARITYVGRLMATDVLRTGNRLTMPSNLLAEAINNDTDGQLSLLFKTVMPGPTGLTWGTHEDIDGNPAANWTVVFQEATLVVNDPADLIIPGDADGDKDVDGDDASAVAANWLVSGDDVTWEMGDFNYDFAVNDIDATILAANWTGPLAVPEPGTITLLLGMIGAAFLAFYRQKR